MKNIDLLPVTDKQRSAILATDTAYRRFQKIRTDVLVVEDGAAVVRIEQFDTVGGIILTKDELLEKGREVFSHAPDLKIRWRPLLYEGKKLDIVSPRWITTQLKTHSMTQQQLADDIGVDKFVISKLVSGNYELTKWHKAALWYYFEAKK